MKKARFIVDVPRTKRVKSMKKARFIVDVPRTKRVKPRTKRVKLLTSTWAEAPTDLLWKIIELLPIVDYVRFGSVCVSWRAALADNRRRTPLLPWLMIRDSYPGTRTPIRFFSLSDNKEYKLDIPYIFRRSFTCIGSSQGWLIFLDISGLPETEITLYNPMSRAHVILPSITTLPRPVKYTAEKFIKVVVSPNHPIMAAAIRYNSKALAFAREGFKSWTTVNTPGYNHFCDIIFSKGQLYGLTKFGAVVVYDLSDNSHPRLALIVNPPERSLDHAEVRKYLVECSGDLLQVQRDMGLVTKFQYMTTDIQIFKMDQAYKWVSVKSIGDHALFLGHNPALAFSSQHFPELRRNCIYLTNVSFNGDPSCELEMYHIGDGLFESLPYTGKLVYPPMFWFSPAM